MLKKLPITVVLFAIYSFALNAQTTIGFEGFSLDSESYYNGSSDHSGAVGSTETFYFTEEAAVFAVDFTQENGYTYWSGFAYSNQTDLETADWNNYSAYSPSGGGADGSDTYAFYYNTSSIALTFTEPVNLTNTQITNSVWAYKFMTGEDGSGHDYETGDYFKLTIKGVLESGDFTDPIDFFLGDFTNGNTTIIGDWTTVDLSSMQAVVGLQFIFSSSDSFTPFYFCMDNLVYDTDLSTASNLLEKVSIYPNPADEVLRVSHVTNAKLSIQDISGKTLRVISNYSNVKDILVSDLEAGVYILKIEADNQVATKKLVIE